MADAGAAGWCLGNCGWVVHSFTNSAADGPAIRASATGRRGSGHGGKYCARFAETIDA
jgi:hypothetical protein